MFNLRSRKVDKFASHRRLGKKLCVLVSSLWLISLAGCAGVSSGPDLDSIHPVITTNSLPPGEVSLAYSVKFAASGGQPPYSWTITSGIVPTGLQLKSSTGELSGTPTVNGQSSFAVELADAWGKTAQQSFIVMVVSPTACASPVYSCARNDLNTSSLPAKLPNWGRRLGANTVFADFSFNSQFPPRYVRVTDANSALVRGVNASMSVGAGSGDDKHFNLDDTLFTLNDSGQNNYFYGLNPATMNTGLVWTGGGDGQWSQVDKNTWYQIHNDGKIYKVSLTGCYLNGPKCQPQYSLMYDFVANCGLDASIVYHEQAGTPGASDTVFAADYSYGSQDSGDEVVVYNTSSDTCYFYNTRVGTIRKYAGTQIPITGTVDLDSSGNITWVSGAQFDPSWAGLYINVNGTYYELNQNVTPTSASFFATSAPFTAGSGLSYSIEPGVLLGTVSSADRFSVHNVRLDPGGNWLIVVSGVNCYSASCVVVHAWQVGSTNVVNCVLACGGHFTESAAGWFNNDGIPGDQRNASTLFRTWANFGTTLTSDLTYLNTSNPPDSPDMHPSNKNDPLGTNSFPVLTSTVPLQSGTSVLGNEIIGYQQPPGPILRFGRTFNSGLSPGFTQKYAIGGASSTGRFYIFTTDGEGTLGNNNGTSTCNVSDGSCRSDVFILDLSPPPATQ